MTGLNSVTLKGNLAAPPELRELGSGSTMLRLLLTVRTSEPRRRVDVIPVTLWNPSPERSAELVGADVGAELRVVGSIQRRFWSGEQGRTSKLEVVAADIGWTS